MIDLIKSVLNALEEKKREKLYRQKEEENPVLFAEWNKLNNEIQELQGKIISLAYDGDRSYYGLETELREKEERREEIGGVLGL